MNKRSEGGGEKEGKERRYTVCVGGVGGGKEEEKGEEQKEKYNVQQCTCTCVHCCTSPYAPLRKNRRRQEEEERREGGKKGGSGGEGGGGKEEKRTTRRCKFIECTVNQSDSFSGFCTYEVDVRGQSESVLYIHLGRSRDSEGTGPCRMPLL